MQMTLEEIAGERETDGCERRFSRDMAVLVSAGGLLF